MPTPICVPAALETRNVAFVATHRRHAPFEGAGMPPIGSFGEA